MSELGAQSIASEQVQSAPVSPGGMLRDARHAAGIHIEALAVALKVPVSKLEALEADNYQVLPDAVFVRALASSVCRSLKIDPIPVLALMPQSSVPRLAGDSGGINATFKDGTERASGGAMMASVKHPAFLAAFALLLGAAVLAFYPRSLTEMSTASDGQVQKTTAITLSEPASVAAAPAEVASAETGALPLVVEAVPADPVIRQELVDSVGKQVPTLPAGVDSIDGKGQLLVLRARSESWVQVRDATGVTTLQKILTAGESVVVPGKPPLSVVIGNAEATEALIRGNALDLAPISKDNVARFEVKP